MADDDAAAPLDAASIRQITQLVKDVLRTEDIARSGGAEQSSRRSHEGVADPSGGMNASRLVIPGLDISHVFSPQWYNQLQARRVRSSFTRPASMTMPEFFRIENASHNITFSNSSRPEVHRSEADTLYQLQAFIHDNLNRQYAIIEEYSSAGVPRVAIDALEENWRHLRGVSEMLQARYDILCGKQVGDPEQVRLLELCTRPAVGRGALAESVNNALRQLWVQDMPFVGNSDASRDATAAITGGVEHSAEELVPARMRREPVKPRSTKYGDAVAWDEVDNAKFAGEGDGLSEVSFVYVLRQYDLVKAKRVHSPWYACGGFRWRLLIFPKGHGSEDDLISVYVLCGGPLTEGNDVTLENSDEEMPQVVGRSGGASASAEGAWLCNADFSLRLLHSTSPIAKAAVGMKKDACFEVSELEDCSAEEIAKGGSCPDLLEELHHVFRASSDDWGVGIAPFSLLKPGLYADADTNVVFLVCLYLLNTSD